MALGQCTLCTPHPTPGPYTAAKGGLRNLTKMMALEWAAHGIQANGIGPGCPSAWAGGGWGVLDTAVATLAGSGADGAHFGLAWQRGFGEGEGVGRGAHTRAGNADSVD